ncbi:MAG: cobalamin-dependent protein [Chloroflexi bacterium]|nr:cobalamin-dependent protein [Chloroflexota bacterium]MDA1219761.1 cobalamin-dependent protein [Chloroflexota bacterium]
MRILLIATNRHNRWMSKEEVRPLPIGLAYVAAYINPKQHSLRVLDLMFSEDYLGETERVVQEFQPQLVGISIRNLDNGSYINPQSALPVTREVIQRIRSCSDATIACGGPAFSALPEECFSYLEPDVGLAGDAAETFAELAQLLEKSKSYRQLSGVVYQEDGEIKMSPQRAASGLARPPRLDDLDLDRYRQAGFGVGVITKLGWYSSTVPSPNPEEEWRIVRPVQEVIEEIKRLQTKHNLNEFFFIDQGFNRPVEYAKELCQCIVAEGLDIKWNTNLRPEGVDQELMSLMVQAGCQMALIGGANLSGYSVLSEGGEEKIQLASELAALQRLCDICQSAGLPYAITQGFGEPSECDETVRTKLAFLSTSAGSNRTARATLRIGNRLMPGTELTQRAIQEGLIPEDSDLLMPVYYVAAAVREELLGTLKEAVQGQPSWSIL